MLIDVQKDGRTIKGLVHPGRDGYLWVLERSADKIGFVAAKPYVTQNAFKSIDRSRDGRRMTPHTPRTRARLSISARRCGAERIGRRPHTIR